ncbi:MAG: hypothetical protein ACK4N5_11430, partial [Myxococcales bacterium]
MLERRFYETYRVVPSPFWSAVCGGAWDRMCDLTGTRVVFEGFTPPDTPVVFATNSTQKYDFMPFRAELRRRGVPTVTVTKGKNYHHPAMAFLLGRLGVVP